jgi:dTDP-4-amino-4,6-dideoxygalactose transaminase
LVCEVDREEFGMTRDALLTILKAEGVLARRYFFPGVHRTPPFAEAHTTTRVDLDATDAVCRSVMQLPLGALVAGDDVDRIADLVRDAHRFASTLRAAASSSDAQETATA